mgnify:CR=1 FL=1
MISSQQMRKLNLYQISQISHHYYLLVCMILYFSYFLLFYYLSPFQKSTIMIIHQFNNLKFPKQNEN